MKMRIFTNADLTDAHRHSTNHRDELRESDRCGCFYCLESYGYQTIDSWVDDDTTALCPNCGIDSVIGSASGYPITVEFLTAMRTRFF